MSNPYQENLLKVLERIAVALERQTRRKAPQPISKDPILEDFLSEIDLDIQQSWVELFKDKLWVEAELKKAAIWCRTNPWKRQPGDTNSRFGLSWLHRASDALKKQPVASEGKSKEKALPPILEHVVVDNPNGTTEVVIRPISKDLSDWTSRAPWEKE